MAADLMAEKVLFNSTIVGQGVDTMLAHIQRTAIPFSQLGSPPATWRKAGMWQSFGKGLTDMLGGLWGNLGNMAMNSFKRIIQGGLTSLISFGIDLAIEGPDETRPVDWRLCSRAKARRPTTVRDDWKARIGGDPLGRGLETDDERITDPRSSRRITSS
jgi:hypothetical protein